MTTTKKTKSELEISFDNYYNVNKWKAISTPILISSIIIFFIDNFIDLSLLIYIVFQLLLSLITIKSYKKAVAKEYVRSTELLSNQNITIEHDVLKIKSKDDELEIKIKDCRYFIKNNFLFVITKIKIKKSLWTRIFVTKYDYNELRDIDNSLHDQCKKRDNHKIILFGVIYAFSILIFLWKIDTFILNRFIYNHDVQWEVVSIENDNKIIINRNSYKLDYLGLKNNFTLDTSSTFSNEYLLNYRHEPFIGVKLLYGSGAAKNHIMDSLIQKGNILGEYHFKYESDTLRLTNDKYQITCRKRK